MVPGYSNCGTAVTVLTEGSEVRFSGTQKIRVGYRSIFNERFFAGRNEIVTDIRFGMEYGCFRAKADAERVRANYQECYACFVQRLPQSIQIELRIACIGIRYLRSRRRRAEGDDGCSLNLDWRGLDRPPLDQCRVRIYNSPVSRGQIPSLRCVLRHRHRRFARLLPGSGIGLGVFDDRFGDFVAVGRIDSVPRRSWGLLRLSSYFFPHFRLLAITWKRIAHALGLVAWLCGGGGLIQPLKNAFDRRLRHVRYIFGTIDGGMTQQDRKSAERHQGKSAGEEERFRSHRLSLKKTEHRHSLRPLRKRSGRRRYVCVPICLGKSKSKIGQQANPETRPWQQPGPMAIEVAVQLNGFFFVPLAEARWVEMQKEGVYSFRHIPP